MLWWVLPVNSTVTVTRATLHFSWPCKELIAICPYLLLVPVCCYWAGFLDLSLYCINLFLGKWQILCSQNVASQDKDTKCAHAVFWQGYLLQGCGECCVISLIILLQKEKGFWCPSLLRWTGPHSEGLNCSIIPGQSGGCQMRPLYFFKVLTLLLNIILVGFFFFSGQLDDHRGRV